MTESVNPQIGIWPKTERLLSMLRVLLMTTLMVAVVGLARPAWSYDEAMAESYAALFAPVTGPAAGKALHSIKPEAVLDKIKAKEPLVALDIRTPAEVGIYGATLPGSLAIPINELFTRANLELIPTDKTVLVVCKSGARAMAAGTALRHIGFQNVFVLEGGFVALVAYLGPKEANTPPKAEQGR